MNLVLYSGGTARENRALAQEALALLAEKESPLIAFIPSDLQDEERDFLDFKRKFRGKNLRFLCVPIERPLSLRQKKELFSADAIFLGGGNTFFFLKCLRAQRLLPRMKTFVQRGGLLMGLSAGSILMTPSIQTALVPALDADENDVGVRSLRAMGLVNFEFSPHYVSTPVVDAELKAYSRKLAHPVYACRDGTGLVVENGRLRAVGPVAVFRRGRKYRLQ